MGGRLLSATLGGFSSLSWVGCHLGAVFVTSLGSGSALGKCKPLGRTQPGPVPALAIKPWGASADAPHHNPPLSRGCWWTGGVFGCMEWVRGTPGGRETPAQNGLCWGGVPCFGTTPVAPQLDWFFEVMTGHFKWCFPPVAAGISLKK